MSTECNIDPFRAPSSVSSTEWDHVEHTSYVRLLSLYLRRIVTRSPTRIILHSRSGALLQSSHVIVNSSLRSLAKVTHDSINNPMVWLGGTYETYCTVTNGIPGISSV